MCRISDKFFSSIRTLSGDGPIKHRLVAAYEEYLADLRDEEIPESIRPRFLSLREALTAVPPANGESTIHASVRKMSPVDAQRYATSILLMLGELVRTRNNSERLAFVRPAAPEMQESEQLPGVIQLHNKAG